MQFLPWRYQHIIKVIIHSPDYSFNHPLMYPSIIHLFTLLVYAPSLSSLAIVKLHKLQLHFLTNIYFSPSQIKRATLKDGR